MKRLLLGMLLVGSTLQMTTHASTAYNIAKGLEPVEINKGTKNLVIVNQGYVGSPPPGSTQAQNYTKYNKESYIDYDGIGVINNLNSSTTQVGIFASSKGETTKNDILSTISSFREKSPDGKLIMVGHSIIPLKNWTTI